MPFGQDTDTDPGILAGPERLSPDTPADGLYPDYTLDRFVPHGANQRAYALASAVALTPGGRLNPCCLVGDRGLGKTHLMHAAGHLIKAGQPTAKILAVSALRLSADLDEAVQSGGMGPLIHRLCSLDALLLDDIGLLSGNPRAQEALLAVFAALRETQRQIIITCDCHPDDVQGLMSRLRSCAENGVFARLQAPNLEARIAILRQKTTEYGEKPLPDEVLRCVAGHASGDRGVADLEHWLRRVLATAGFTGQPVSLRLAEKVLGPHSACQACTIASHG